jgi:alpha-N-arabinofuranosidase
LKYSADDWYELLHQADFMDSLVSQHWTAMGEYDKQRKVKLVVDEWGAWHHTTSLGPGYLYSFVPALRDALVTALTLDIFNRHAEKLAMCNVAQLVNNINTLFLTREDRLVTTTVFHVFDMYKSHQGGQSLRMVCDAPEIAYGEGKQFWGLAGSASLQGKALVVTVVNPHASDPCVAEVSLRGGTAKSGQVTVLTAPDIHAHNDFDNPDSVAPESGPAAVSRSHFTWTFPPASVTKLEIELA